MNPHEQLLIAIRNDDAHEVQRFIPLCDPKQNQSEALRKAAIFGHTECVKLLIPVSDCAADDNRALRQAAYAGHVDCVALLIPVSDHKNNQSSALAAALQGGRLECAELLYDVSDLGRALQVLKKTASSQESIRILTQRIAAQKEHAIIQESINDTQHATLRKKM